MHCIYSLGGQQRLKTQIVDDASTHNKFKNCQQIPILGKKNIVLINFLDKVSHFQKKKKQKKTYDGIVV